MELKQQHKKKIVILIPITTIILSSAALIMILQAPTYPDADEINGTEYESIVIFRNDDPAPWTEKETLKDVNQIFIENQIPLTHGVVPHDENANTSLEENHEVCEYLRDEKENNEELFSYSLHGYHHLQETEFQGQSEFGDLSKEEQQQKIREGKNIIEDCTGETTTTFIPPFNTYDEITVQTLAEENFTLISGGATTQEEYFGERGLWEDEQLIHLPSSLHMEDWETEDVKNLETMKEQYQNNKENQEINVVLFHYFFFTEEDRLEKLEQLMTYMKEDGAKFLTLEEFAEKQQNEDIIKTREGWAIKE